MKRLLLIIASVCFLLCLFASCGSQTTLEKLHTVKKGWSPQQVAELLGQSGRDLGFSSCIALEYTIDDTTTATVFYRGEHLDECFMIHLKNTETGEYTTILE